MPEQQKKHLAIKIRFAREIKGLTQKQVARALGVSQPYYHRIEKGAAEVSISQLFLLSRILDLNFGECIRICIGAEFIMYDDESLSVNEAEFEAKIRKICAWAEEQLLKKNEIIEKLRIQLNNLQQRFL